MMETFLKQELGHMKARNLNWANQLCTKALHERDPDIIRVSVTFTQLLFLYCVFVVSLTLLMKWQISFTFLSENYSPPSGCEWTRTM